MRAGDTEVKSDSMRRHERLRDMFDAAAFVLAVTFIVAYLAGALT